jgi:hypothetical protein
MVTTRPGTDDIWGWLDLVPDPEIPVISVVDLGIVRDVAWEGETLVVTVTPTYSGCPATALISMEIEVALRASGHRRPAARDEDRAALDHRLAQRKGPRAAGGIRHRTAQPRGRAGALPPLWRDGSRTHQPVRLHPLQGAMALPRLSGTLRLFQVHLRTPCPVSTTLP